MNPKLIEEINKLANKEKAEGLSPEEKKRQKELRDRYIKEFRKSFKSRLDNIDITYVD